MAGIAYVRKRLYNPEILIDTNNVIGNRLKNYLNGKNRPVYEITWTGTTQVGEELGTAAASVKDGTTTPFIVTMVSSDVADDRGTAAGAVHSAALIGITCDADGVDGDGNYIAGSPTYSTVEVVAMDGTTDVLATRLWLWLDGIYAVEWGTGAADATGNITAESPANTTLITLPAGNNEGEGGSWHFPPDRLIKTHHTDLVPTSALAAGDGVVLTATWTATDQVLNTDPDLNVDYYSYITRGGGAAPELDKIGRYTTAATKCLWSEALVANGIVFHIHIVQELH